MAATAQCSICRQTITCYYLYNETQTVSFKYKAKTSNPATEVGFGQLAVQMRLAHGEETYDTRKLAGKHFKQLVFFVLFFFSRWNVRVLLPRWWVSSEQIFEAATVLWGGTGPVLWPKAGAHTGKLLGHCKWGQNLYSQLGHHCQRVNDERWIEFHTVNIGTELCRAVILSLKCCIYSCSCPNHEDRYVTAFHTDDDDPLYFKRFSMNMFTFTKNDEVLKNEVSWLKGCWIRPWGHCSALSVCLSKGFQQCVNLVTDLSDGKPSDLFCGKQHQTLRRVPIASLLDAQLSGLVLGEGGWSPIGMMGQMRKQIQHPPGYDHWNLILAQMGHQWGKKKIKVEIVQIIWMMVNCFGIE